MNPLPPQGPGELVIYQTADGGTRLQVRLAGESVGSLSISLPTSFGAINPSFLSTSRTSSPTRNWIRRELLQILQQFKPRVPAR